MTVEIEYLTADNLKQNTQKKQKKTNELQSNSRSKSDFSLLQRHRLICAFLKKLKTTQVTLEL